MNLKFWALLIITIIFISGCVQSEQSIQSASQEDIKTTFNAIDLVKAKIPSDMKNRVWYSKEWKQEKVDGKTWKVTVSDAVWKVSNERIFCSQTGEFVSICSDNGLANTYSSIKDYCKPLSMCETPEEQQEQTNIKESEPEQSIEFDDDTWVSLTKTNLVFHGLDISSIQVVDGRNNGGVKALIIEYKSTAIDETELAGETGYIMGSFLEAAKDWDIDELLVTVGDEYGNVVGMWYVSKEWKDDYLKGKMTMEEVALKVIDSMATF